MLVLLTVLLLGCNVSIVLALFDQAMARTTIQPPARAAAAAAARRTSHSTSRKASGSSGQSAGSSNLFVLGWAAVLPAQRLRRCSPCGRSAGADSCTRCRRGSHCVPLVSTIQCVGKVLRCDMWSPGEVEISLQRQHCFTAPCLPGACPWVHSAQHITALS